MARSLALSGADVGLRVRGDDLDRLGEIAAGLASHLKGVPGIADVNVAVGEGKPEFVVRIRDDALAKYPGLDPRALGDRIVDSVRGRVATSFREFDKSSDVRVRLDDGAGANVEDLLDGLVPCGDARVPLSELVTWEIARGPREIRRGDQQRAVLVNAGPPGRQAEPGRARIREAIAATPLPPGYRIVFGGERRGDGAVFPEPPRGPPPRHPPELHDHGRPVRIPGPPAHHPRHRSDGTLRLRAAMLLTGTTVNVISVIGIVVLLGIVVDNAIVKIDYTNQLRKRGMGLREAVVEGSRVRLRPILMSTATTLVALLPLSLGIGSGAELLQPLGIVVFGGLTFATLLTPRSHPRDLRDRRDSKGDEGGDVLKFLIERPVAVAMIYVALLALGVFSFMNTPIELAPGGDYPRDRYRGGVARRFARGRPGAGHGARSRKPSLRSRECATFPRSRGPAPLPSHSRSTPGPGGSTSTWPFARRSPGCGPGSRSRTGCGPSSVLTFRRPSGSGRS